MRISDLSSDVCSSDLPADSRLPTASRAYADAIDLRSSGNRLQTRRSDARNLGTLHLVELAIQRGEARLSELGALVVKTGKHTGRSAQDKLIVRDVLTKEDVRSEEHTSELQSLMRISYAVFCLKKKKRNNTNTNKTQRRNT